MCGLSGFVGFNNLENPEKQPLSKVIKPKEDF